MVLDNHIQASLGGIDNDWVQMDIGRATRSTYAGLQHALESGNWIRREQEKWYNNVNRKCIEMNMYSNGSKFPPLYGIKSFLVT